jgi:dienelactone hydrolase
VERVDVFEFEGARHAFTRPEKVTPKDIEAGFGYDENAARTSWSACASMLDDAFPSDVTIVN